MSKCKNSKNPCKICLQTVTQKTGLQCQGACQSWVHYTCLNYTPGRIKDIKAGIISVNCPCPDCKTSSPKEFRTDEPFSCTNLGCPAYMSPKCENTVCPRNKNQIPKPLEKCGLKDCKGHILPQTSSSGGSPYASSEDVPGDMQRGSAPAIPIQTVKQMCNTVGQLTNQLNELMKKINQGQDTGSCGATKKAKPCNQKGPSSQCPKPCNCPGNPGRKK